MSLLNRGLTLLIDGLMRPFRSVPPMLSLAVLALLTAIAMLCVLRATLDHRRIEAAKRRTHAALFEMRLYQDDLRAVMRAALDAIRYQGAYLRVWLGPMLIVTAPMVLLLAQLDAFYGYSGVAPNQHALLIADVRNPGAVVPPLRLDAPEGVRVETPALWFPAAGQVVWRISPSRSGQFELQVRAGGSSAVKTLEATGAAVARRSPRRVQASLVEQLRYPSEAPLAQTDPIASIAVEYPGREVDVLGWRLHWLVPYFILSVVFAYALKKPFGVVM
jgi:uncharacterized membrane protein (DUF106 family)